MTYRGRAKEKLLVTNCFLPFCPATVPLVHHVECDAEFNAACFYLGPSRLAKMSEYEYSGLLFDISEKLDVNKLPRLLFICRKDIAEGSEENIHDARAVFKELEKQNRIGIDHLENLKEILTQMKKPSLRKKVEEFEIRRKGIHKISDAGSESVLTHKTNFSLLEVNFF